MAGFYTFKKTKGAQAFITDMSDIPADRYKCHCSKYLLEDTQSARISGWGLPESLFMLQN